MPLRCLVSLLRPAVFALPVLLSPLAASDYHDWADTPPMGWNSWDNFGTAITEAQVKDQAAYFAAHLKSHGWQYFVVDIQWYQPTAEGHGYKAGAALTMDGFGRLLPAPNRFPSAAGGAGFKPLADEVHRLGLHFGVHLMRGIPRQAVEANLPIAGTRLHAQDIADRGSLCPWNPDMYGVDTTRPGAQAYYDSVFALFASWGLDFVKVDDIARPYHQGEIEAIRSAIDRSGRPIVLSLSPGDTPLSAGPHVREHANMWRISDDFWDRWLALRAQFGRLEKWNLLRKPGAWPDADMLPLGVIDLDSRHTRFTPDEQRTLMTLWSIARSPLMHGGDLVRTDEATLALLTNDAVLAVDQHSSGNRPLFNRDGLIAWTADRPGTADKYLAVFNTRDRLPLSADHAKFVSGDVTAAASTAAPVDVDVRGGRRLMLVMEPGAGGREGGMGLWRNARFVNADGSTHPLANLSWTSSDALWDSATVRKDPAGQPVGIAAQTSAIIEYAIPAQAVRFAAQVEVEADKRRGPGASVRFLVVVGTDDNEDRAEAVPVPVELATLGLLGPVSVQDLWSGRELAPAKGTFAPAVPFHGAGLYRLTPR